MNESLFFCRLFFSTLRTTDIEEDLEDHLSLRFKIGPWYDPLSGIRSPNE